MPGMTWLSIFAFTVSKKGYQIIILIYTFLIKGTESFLIFSGHLGFPFCEFSIHVLLGGF